jgi:hypothetical protein
MPGQLQTAIELSLKDKFSPSIKNAGNATGNFKDQAVNAANSIDKAFSSVGATLATLGVTIGAAALIKKSIDYEDSIIRIGTNAGMSGSEVNQFRRDLLAVATDAKVPIQELVKFSQVVTDNSIGLDVASESARFMADAIQGLGLSGQEAADIFSVLYQKSGNIDTVKQKLNNLAEIDNRLQGMGMSQFARFLPELMEASDAAADNIEDLYISILTLNNGATNKQALAQYKAAMDDFSKNRDDIKRRTGFDVKDHDGELKSFSEIISALVDKGKKVGGIERFKKAFNFNDNTIKAIKQFNKYSAETIERVSDMGDTSTAVRDRADQNAKSLAANLVSLHNNILKLADASLTKPIEGLAKLLDKHPKGMELAIKGVGGAILALTAMKGFSTVVKFISDFQNVKGKGIGNIGTGLSGGAVTPVYVTNWGGMGGGPGMPGMGAPGKNTPAPVSKLTSLLTRAGPYLAFAYATIKLSKFIDKKAVEKFNIDGKHYTEWEQQARDAEQSGDRESELEARIAALRIQIPEYERLRAGFGPEEKFQHWDISGKAQMVTLNDLRSELSALQIEAGFPLPGIFEEMPDKSRIPEGLSPQTAENKFRQMYLPPQIPETKLILPPQQVELGQADIKIDVNLTDKRPELKIAVDHNTIPARFNTGSRTEYSYVRC